MKNVFFFAYEEKRLDKKGMVNFKTYYITDWTTNNCNKHIAQISRSKGNHTKKFGQLKECSMRNNFLEEYLQKVVEKLAADPIIKNQN